MLVKKPKYAVVNMPGAVPRTSTFALTNPTIPYAITIANKGIVRAAIENETVSTGVNTYKKHLTMEAVAKDQNKDYTPVAELLK